MKKNLVGVVFGISIHNCYSQVRFEVRIRYDKCNDRYLPDKKYQGAEVGGDTASNGCLWHSYSVFDGTSPWIDKNGKSYVKELLNLSRICLLSRR